MGTRLRRHLAGYGGAVPAVALALGVKVWLARAWAVEDPFLLFLGAVLFAARSGGIGPGLFATLLAALAAESFFLDPRPGLSPPTPAQALRLVQFLLEGAFISVLSGLRKRSHDGLLSRVVAVSEAERRRLSRELHDETSQQLAALILGLRAIRDRSPPDGPAAAALAGLQEQAERIGAVLHRIAFDLRPAALDELGLEASLRDAVGQWSRRTGIPAEFFSTLGPGRLPAGVEIHVYRMVTEALTNVLKHARADRISVIAERAGDGLTVIVEDNGRGFDADAVLGDAGGSRLGLRGMRERAALLGGTVELESSTGDGTTVFIRVPRVATGGGEG